MCARRGSRGERGGWGGGDIIVVYVAIAIAFGALVRIVVVAFFDMVIGYLIVPLGLPLPNGKRPEAEHYGGLCVAIMEGEDDFYKAMTLTGMWNCVVKAECATLPIEYHIDLLYGMQ